MPRGFSNRKTSVADLQKFGVNTKICAYCKKSLQLRIHQINDIPSYYLFINRNQDIYVIMHRKCKKKYMEKIRK